MGRTGIHGEFEDHTGMGSKGRSCQIRLIRTSDESLKVSFGVGPDIRYMN